MSSNQTEKEKKIEKKVIEKAIMDYYHEGHVKSDPELYKKILHDEWKFFLFDEDNRLWIVDKDEYLSWYNPEKVNKDLNWKTRFYYIDITGNIAAEAGKLVVNYGFNELNLHKIT
ncbi:MAG: hypothetical protein KAT57_07325, partial [Candidatus Lokiarchaeota archaeon]|nr:hypothetical protein [Candidatus Lokiarchaeota archaeon]